MSGHRSTSEASSTIRSRSPYMGTTFSVCMCRPHPPRPPPHGRGRGGRGGGRLRFPKKCLSSLASLRSPLLFRCACAALTPRPPLPMRGRGGDVVGDASCSQNAASVLSPQSSVLFVLWSQESDQESGGEGFVGRAEAAEDAGEGETEIGAAVE